MERYTNRPNIYFIKWIKGFASVIDGIFLILSLGLFDLELSFKCSAWALKTMVSNWESDNNNE